MVKFISIPVLLTLLLSCAKEQRAEYVPPATIAPNPPAVASTTKTYLALGDSYTIGQSVAIDQRYPEQTVSMLIADSINISNPEIIAQSGWTTTQLINAINTKPPTKAMYDMVSLLIGVNNQYQQIPLDTYRTEFALLLSKSIAFAGNKKSHVFVLSIPDWGVTPFASGFDKAQISAEIDAYNKINKDITLKEGCIYVDITPVSRLVANDPTLVAHDGLHPSGKEYQQWALLLIPFVKAAFR